MSDPEKARKPYLFIRFPFVPMAMSDDKRKLEAHVSNPDEPDKGKKSARTLFWVVGWACLRQVCSLAEGAEEETRGGLKVGRPESA